MQPATLNEMIDISRRDGIGVGMFNIVNLEFARAIWDASQETELPAMMGMPERFFRNFYDLESMTAACAAMIRKSKVPIALHLDHGKSFEGVMAALKAGFRSVMFDGSSLPYEENVARTAEIVKIAHAMGASVEGELGYVGRSGVDAVREDGFTKPEQAADFAERTGVDALAVAIGNQHGEYKAEPVLDFPRLRAIRDSVGCALVLHGGTGISEADFLEAIRSGVAKVNIYTAMDLAAKRVTNERFALAPTYLDYTAELTAAVKDVVADHMLLFAMRREARQR